MLATVFKPPSKELSAGPGSFQNLEISCQRGFSCCFRSRLNKQIEGDRLRACTWVKVVVLCARNTFSTSNLIKAKKRSLGTTLYYLQFSAENWETKCQIGNTRQALENLLEIRSLVCRQKDYRINHCFVQDPWYFQSSQSLT